jgi:nucleotide-binding universal stress UspA family protein
MKRILVPFDFSVQAGFAFDLACEIAHTNKATVTLLHVIDYTGMFDFASGSSGYPIMGSQAILEHDERFLELQQNTAEEKLRDFVKDCDKKGTQIQIRVRLGNAYHFITREINDDQVDLVVMGSKGVSGLEEMLIGSNTEKVVRHSKSPVLTVKSPVVLSDIKNIVFASNFTEEESHLAADLKKLQKAFQARLHLVRVTTPNNFETTRHVRLLMEQFVKNNAIDNFSTNIYNDRVEEDGIIYFAQDIEADMIALATHGRTGLLHLLGGSIAEDVVNHAKRPVWTFRLHKS